MRSLGPLAKVFSVSSLLLAFTACGTNGTNQSQNMCGGCSFLYATTNADQILSYKLDSSGTLGTPVIAPGTADSPDLAAANGGSLYVSDVSGNILDGFVVNPDGTLTEELGSPFGLGGSSGVPAGIVNFGNFLYVGDTNGTISGFNVTSVGLTSIAGSPFAAGMAPLYLVTAYINPPNASSVPVLYASDLNRDGIWAFTIGSSGSLTLVAGSPFATPNNSAPTEMFVGGDAISGSILYVALSGLNQIAAFTIVNQSGALTPLPSSPFAAGRGPVSLFGYGWFLYALNSTDHTISAYSMDQNTGALTEIQGSPFSAGTASAGIINNTRNTSIFYVPDLLSNVILGYKVDNSTGSLAPLAGSPFPTGVGPVALTTVSFPAVDPP